MRPWFGVLRKGREVVILGGRSAKAVRPLFLCFGLSGSVAQSVLVTVIAQSESSRC